METLITSIGKTKKIEVLGVEQDILDRLFGIGYNYVIVGEDGVEEALVEIKEDYDLIIAGQLK